MWSIRDKGKIDEEEMLSNYCFLQHMQCHYVLADGYKSQTSLKSRSGKQERGFFFFQDSLFRKQSNINNNTKVKAGWQRKNMKKKKQTKD
jgi:hypothetical protein